MLGVKRADAGGRAAYLACFRAARALMFERTGMVTKTHNGVQTECLRLTKDGHRIAGELRAFLRQSYNLKTIADRETGPGQGVSASQAANAVDVGARFVDAVRRMIPPSASPGGEAP